MNEPLPPLLQLVLKFMRDFYTENDQLPPYRAICDEFGWPSTNNARYYCGRLQKRGLIEKNAVGKYRFSRKGKLCA